MKYISLFSIAISVIGIFLWFLFYSSASLPYPDPTFELLEQQSKRIKILNFVILNLIIMLVLGIFFFIKSKNEGDD